MRALGFGLTLASIFVYYFCMFMGMAAGQSGVISPLQGAWLPNIVTAVVAYLLGSIPTGFLVAKARGVDIRTVGSGNIGATNAFRVLGKGFGIFVLLMDALKGWVAVQIGPCGTRRRGVAHPRCTLGCSDCVMRSIRS